MLVLSRKPGEQIRVGENITITVVEVRGNRIKLGIEAPRSVDVVRSELERQPRPPQGKASTGRPAANVAADNAVEDPALEFLFCEL